MIKNNILLQLMLHAAPGAYYPPLGDPPLLCRRQAGKKTPKTKKHNLKLLKSTKEDLGGHGARLVEGHNAPAAAGGGSAAAEAAAVAVGNKPRA